MDNVTPLPTPDQDLVGPGSQREKGGMTDFDGLPVLISVPRAAELLGISRASAYRYAESGELPVKRFVAAFSSSGTDFATFWRQRERPRSAKGKDLPLLLRW
jgi:hypothetical protein